MQNKTLIFDYDGTIHNTIHLYKPAFLKAYAYLVRHGFKPPKDFKDEEITQFLGQNPKEMWQNFAPDLSDSIRKTASQIISNAMKEGMHQGEALLYPNALKTLEELKKRGYELIFLSNCKIAYMKSHAKLFKLDTVFNTMVCAEMYNYISKTDIIAKIFPEDQKPLAIIGDRYHDIEAGKAHQIITVACLYGYGKESEHQGADYFIHDIKELLGIFK